MEARDLAQRATIAGISGRVVDDDVVALRLRGEVAVNDFRFDPARLLRVFLETLEGRLELVLHRCLVLVAGTARTPLQAIELVEIEQVENFVERDVTDDAGSPERRLGYRIVGRDFAALAAGI